MKLLETPFLYMGPEDAARLMAADGDRVRIRPVRGNGSAAPMVEVAIRIDAKYPPGMVFFPESFNQPPVKDLLTLVTNKDSRVPVFKTADVTLEKVS